MLRAITVLAISALSFAACTSSKKSGSETVSPNTLSKKETSDGWQLLFDGSSTKGWHTYGKSSVGSSWQAVDGTLHLNASDTTGGGDIITNEIFENYHLILEWKISLNGNSGVIFNIQEDPAKFPEPWHTGPEMQVLDNDGHADGKIFKHRSGNLYDLIASPTDPVKPVGEWNTAEIIQNRGKLEFRLNGVTTVSTTEGDDAWKALIAASKFKTKPVFGTIFSGKLGLQDHGNDVWYRNIKIQKL